MKINGKRRLVLIAPLAAILLFTSTRTTLASTDLPSSRILTTRQRPPPPPPPRQSSDESSSSSSSEASAKNRPPPPPPRRLGTVSVESRNQKGDEDDETRKRTEEYSSSQIKSPSLQENDTVDSIRKKQQTDVSNNDSSIDRTTSDTVPPVSVTGESENATLRPPPLRPRASPATETASNELGKGRTSVLTDENKKERTSTGFASSSSSSSSPDGEEPVLRPLTDTTRRMAPPPPVRMQHPSQSTTAATTTARVHPATTSIHTMGSDLRSPPNQRREPPHRRSPPPEGGPPGRVQQPGPPPPRFLRPGTAQRQGPPVQQQQQQQQQQQRPPPGQPLRQGPPGQRQPRPGSPPQQQEYRHPRQQQQQQQQRQQQQQHYRPPPRQQRPSPQHQKGGQLQAYRRPAAAPQLKRFWNRIEQGLDNLASLEDVVSDRASQLYATAKETVLGGGTNGGGDDVDDSIPVGSSIQQLWKARRRKNTAPAPPPTPLMDMSRFEKKVVSAKTNGTVPIHATTTSTLQQQRQQDGTGKDASQRSSSSSIPTNPYGVVLETPSVVMKEEQVQATEQRMHKLEQPVQTRPPKVESRPTATAEPPSSRKIDWGHVTSSGGKQPSPATRVIRANGGGSGPPSGSGRPPSRTGGPSQQRPSNTAQPSSRAKAAAKPLPKRRAYDDSDDESWRSRIASKLPGLPGLPTFRNPFRRRSSKDMYTLTTLDAWKADDDNSRKKNPGTGFLARLFPKSDGTAQIPSEVKVPGPLSDLMKRCDNGKSASLLTAADRDACNRIGSYQATMDLLTIGFLLFGLHQLPGMDHHLLPASTLELFTRTMPGFLNSFVSGMDTFAPFLLAATFLSIQTRKLTHEERIGALTQSIYSSISEDAKYGALFLRLFSASTSSQDIPDRLLAAARSQITAKVDAARLMRLVTALVALMVVMTATVARPLLSACMQAIEDIVGLVQIQTWPPQGKDLGKDLGSIATTLLKEISSAAKNEFAQLSENPMRFVYGLSIAASLIGVAHLSKADVFGVPKVLESPEPDVDDDEDDDALQFAKVTEQVANLGTSSCTRLVLLSDSGGIDAALERWRQMIPNETFERSNASLGAVLHRVVKGIGSGFLLMLPILVHSYAGLSQGANPVTPKPTFPRWDCLFDVAIVLLFTQGLAWRAMSSSALATDLKQGIVGFLSSLASAIEERSRIANAPPANLQMQASVSSAAGIAVRDLWAAHTTKRAWAVRGASLECRNGEILVVLGDDAAGKSRLLTALAETICEPPRRALTTNKVRGFISIGGMDVTKWDNRLLRKRMGLLLNDVRTISDLSQILSGLSLEEILEPSGGIRNLELSHNPTSSERACMMLALKITGLYSTLLPKLPSKMSTIVTANEDDVLRPSSLRPLYQILSPAEWSKLLLARVLAQTVYDNVNVAGSKEKVENCLMGSFLILDDATLHLNEVEEARLLRELRKTGAATVLTSNRWASGRFADRVAVVKDGAVVESGSHAELLNRGPQRSLYAAKWHAMTTTTSTP